MLTILGIFLTSIGLLSLILKPIIKPNKLQIRHFLKDIKGNLYSLYCLKTPDVLEVKEYQIDQKVKGFGDCFLIIKNVNEFLNRIFIKLKKLNIDFEAKLVNYYEKEKINGEVSLFQKPNNFEWQKEYRILLYINYTKPFSLRIGDLRDIAELFKIDMLDKMKIEITKDYEITNP